MCFVIITSCNYEVKNESLSAETYHKQSPINKTSLIVLGTVQDAGSPHIACKKDCCKLLFERPDENRKVVSLGVIDPENNKTYLFEATPDIPAQMKELKARKVSPSGETPDGIFLTHAHIGHYAGLMYLGKEAMNAKRVPVFAMPVMKKFLEGNGPWSLLVSNQNISIQELSDKKPVQLTSNLKVVPFIVPHRDEYSETVGYTILGPEKKVLFIPDIDKWSKWEKNIIEEVGSVDYAFVDATFYDGEEINHRDISEIPHPFIIETMSLFENLPDVEKDKIHFIHMNHTNPALNLNSSQAHQIINKGFNIAQIGDVFEL